MADTKGSRLSLITTPLRMILPGVIVSLIGASMAYYLFNNPTKIRGRATKAAWEVIKEYERLYQENVDQFGCTAAQASGGFDNTRFYKDMLHQQEVIVANFETLQKEQDVDSKLLSILNIKTVSYKELKTLTQDFLNKLTLIDERRVSGYFTYLGEQAYLDTLKKEQYSYLVEREYIESRDSITVHRILAQLSDAYDLRFTTDNTALDLNTLPQKLLGSWRISGLPYTLILRASGKGMWKEKGQDGDDITWTLTGNNLSIVFDEGRKKEMNITVLRCTDHVLSIYFTEEGMALAACR